MGHAVLYYKLLSGLSCCSTVISYFRLVPRDFLGTNGLVMNLSSRFLIATGAALAISLTSAARLGWRRA